MFLRLIAFVLLAFVILGLCGCAVLGSLGWRSSEQKRHREMDFQIGALEVKIKYQDGEKSTRIRGIIQQADEESVTLDKDQELIQIKFSNIELAKLVIEF